MKHKSSTELQARAWRARLEALLDSPFELEAQARSSFIDEPGSHELKLEARIGELSSFLPKNLFTHQMNEYKVSLKFFGFKLQIKRPKFLYVSMSHATIAS